MRTFRAKLIAIVAVDAFALLALVLLSMVIEGRVGAQLASIQRHQVPRIGLQPRLEATMTTVADAFEDAASANDLERLDDVRGHEREFTAQIAGARDAIDPADAAALRAALADYIASAQAITRRIIADDSGEDFVDDMREMQVRQARVVALIALSTRFDEEEMGRAFDAAAAAQRTGAKIRLALSAACVVLVLLLTIWIGRSLFRTLGELAAGFRRFGDGDFAIAIPATARDELGVAAGQANQMAARLQRLMAERDDIDWLKGGQAGLAESLRGELEPGEVAERALAFLARYLEAPTATLYYAADDGALVLLGQHGVEPGAVAPPIVWSELGSTTELTIVGDRVRLPLLHLGDRVGVVELIAAATARDQAAELLQAVRDSLTITIEVARARAATRALLA